MASIYTHIDDVDIQATYGMVLGGESLPELMKLPAMKSPAKVDYPDVDGTQADLTAPTLLSRNLKLTFYDVGGKDPADFITFLMREMRHTIDVDIVNGVPLWITTFRMVGNPELSMYQNKGKIVIEVVDYDSFLYGYVYSMPHLTAKSYGFTLSGADLSLYGIVPVGSANVQEINKAHGVKAPLEWSNSLIDGSKFDRLAVPRKKNRDVKLTLWGSWARNEMNAWKAFLYDLTRPGYRSISGAGKLMSGWYKSSNIEQLSYHNGRVDILFNITFEVYQTIAL